jgi:hypothetical protein
MKWNNYYTQYLKHFPPNPSKIVELGVLGGDGLKWLHHHYPNAKLVGLDRDLSKCPPGPWSLYRCNVCALTDRGYVKTLAQGADVIIDDAGHRPYQQSLAFNALFPVLKDGGVYAVEDLHLGRRLDWRLFSYFFGFRKLLHSMIDQQSKWEGPTTPSLRTPAEIVCTPQLVLIKKGTVAMRVQ